MWDNNLGEFGKQAEKGALNENYGRIEGSYPAGLPNPITGIRNLSTKDIPGAQTGTKNKGSFASIERRQIREVNVTNDIAGCKADTLKRAPTTNRITNPIEP